jgi:hypothetical protein
MQCPRPINYLENWWIFARASLQTEVVCRCGRAIGRLGNNCEKKLCIKVAELLLFVLKYTCDVWTFKNRITTLQINPFLFIKNEHLLLSSESFSTLEKRPRNVMYQRAMLLIQSEVTALCR